MIIKRERYFEAEVLNFAATDKFELPESGILSYLKLDFRATTAANIFTKANPRIVDRLTEIKISDGGTRTMFSLRGQEIKALIRAMQGSILPETAIFSAAESQLTTLVIPLGRYLRDPEFALDCSKFPDLYLEITNNFTATQFTAGSVSVDIQLIYLENLPRIPAEYMKHFTWREGKPRADGQHVYHELSSIDPLYLVMCQLDPDLNDTGEPSENPASDSYNLKMTLDDRTTPLWDHRPKDIWRDNAATYGTVITHVRTVPSTTQYTDCCLAYVHSFADAQIGAAQITALATHENNNDRFFKLVDTGTTPTMLAMIFEGIGYYHTMMLYHAFDTDRANWLNPGLSGASPRGPIRIDMYGHKDDFTLRTCLSTPKAQGST